MRTLYDSTTAGDIPAKAAMVAGYLDGNYQTVPALLKRFPHALIVTITVKGTPGAHVCDTEPGNIGITGAAKWAAAEVKAGRRPTLYHMASQRGLVRRAVRKSVGLRKRKLVSYWEADYDGDPTLPKGCVAKQYLHGDKNHPGSYSGGHYDTSVVADYWPGVDSEPVKPQFSRFQRALIRRVTQLLGNAKRLDDPDERKRVAGAVAAGEAALKR